MKTLTTVGALLLAAQAHTATAQEPTPGPEIQKLGYYLGTWQGEGEAREGPFGPGGKLSSTTSCAWFDGGFHLVCRGEEQGPTGKRKFLNIRAYDSAKGYTEYSISNQGEIEYNTGGSIAGNKRSFAFETALGGKPTKLRYTEEQLSPTLFTYLAEASIDGGPWNVIAQGKVTRVSASPASTR